MPSRSLAKDEVNTAYEAAVGKLLAMPDYPKTPTEQVATTYFHHDRIIRLWSAAGNPQVAYPVILVGGSDGKGSISVMIANILREAGYRVGLWTKPHFHSHRERMRIDMDMISPDEFVDVFGAVMNSVSRSLSGISTQYEAMLTMALVYFRRHGVDVAVIEGGVGGYIDALSVIAPDSVAYGYISLDHVPLLGTTLEEIAREKSGLIKTGCSVVSHPQNPEALAQLRSAAESKGAPFYQVGKDIAVAGVPKDDDRFLRTVIISYLNRELSPEPGLYSQTTKLSLAGTWQYANAGVAVGSAVLFGGRRVHSGDMGNTLLQGHR